MDASITQSITRLATPEVFTVVGLGIAMFTAYKVTGFAVNIAKSFCTKFSILGITTALLFLSGLGTGGVGFGELMARWSDGPSAKKDYGLTDEKVLTLAEKCQDREVMKEVINYVKSRDSQNRGDKTAEVERILALVESMPPDKRGEATVALISFMQNKQEKKFDASTAVASSNLLASLGETASRTAPQTGPTITERNAQFPIQSAFGMMAWSIASIVTSGILWRRYLTPATRTA